MRRVERLDRGEPAVGEFASRSAAWVGRMYTLYRACFECAEWDGEFFDPPPRAIEQEQTAVAVVGSQRLGVDVESDVAVERARCGERRGSGEPQAGCSSERKDRALGPTFPRMDDYDGVGKPSHAPPIVVLFRERAT